MVGFFMKMDTMKYMDKKSLDMTFEEVYHRYGERILNLAYRFTHQKEVARDLTQDVFIKVFENLDKFEQQSQMFTWIYRIAINHLLNYIKRERKRKWIGLLDEKIMDLFHGEGETGFFSSLPPPDHVLEKKERENLILRIINMLPLKYRVPLVLQRYEGLSYREIADTLNISVSAIETRIHRAKKLLIQKLEPWIKNL